MIPEDFQYHMPSKVAYGEGLVERLYERVERFGKRTAFIITDKIIEQNGMVESLKKGLADSEIEIGAIYNDVPQNSEVKTVTEAAALGKEKKCDLIIGIGGGSVMDTAKVVNLLMYKGGKLEDHMGAGLLTEPIHPMFFIPTTAGTGSEVTQYAVISDVKNNIKLPFAEEYFLPELAVLDPKMTVTMPGRITAATGMDALTHAIEAYVSIDSNPVAEAIALHAIELIGSNIRQACANPTDIGPRGAMLVAATMAAISIHHSGVGMVHGISHGLGGVYHIPHGLANAIILPFSIGFNIHDVGAKYARISEALGDVNLYPIAELSKQVSRFDLGFLSDAVDQLSFLDEWLIDQKARRLEDKLRILNRQLSALSGHATNLRDAGIKDNLAKLDLVVERAMQDGSMLYNPRQVKAEDVRDIVRQAYEQQEPPLEVSVLEMKASKARSTRPKLRNVFADESNLYEVLGGFFRKMSENSNLVKPLVDSNLIARFNYTHPDASIAMDNTGPSMQVKTGDEARNLKVDVEMTLKADTAHYFWHGQVNPVKALATREVIPKGNLARAMDLLPALKPAFELYPQYLRDQGLSKLVVS